MFTLAKATDAKQPFCQRIYCYGNTSNQARHVLPLEAHHNILANQISLTDFCQGTLCITTVILLLDIFQNSTLRCY